MSSIASGMNAERTNRWLLIGAAVLALGAAVLVFLLLANVGGDDDGASSGSGPDVTVLVANQTIPVNTEITASMFDEVTVSESQTVADYASTSSQVVGRAATAEIIEGQQISLAQTSGGTTEDVDEAGLASVIDASSVGFTLGADEISNVAGFVQAGDRVNVVGVFAVEVEQVNAAAAADDSNVAFTRVETLLQHVEVLAVAQAPVDAVPAADPATDGETTTDGEATSTDSERARPEDVEPNPDAGNVTVHVSLQDAQLLAAARAQGEIFLELRALGDEAVAPIEPTCFDTYGAFPCPPARRTFQ